MCGRWIAWGCGALLAGVGGVAIAGQLQAVRSADYHSHEALEERSKALLDQAANSAGGSANASFEQYPGHTTALVARTRSGGGEVHRHLNDVFFVVDGEATLITGGHVVDPKDTSPDEVRGMRVDGGESHVLRKGDVLHISSGTPHQTIVEPGKAFVYFVVKVGDAPARMMPASR